MAYKLIEGCTDPLATEAIRLGQSDSETNYRPMFDQGSSSGSDLELLNRREAGQA